jgi:hypothetical protein
MPDQKDNLTMFCVVENVTEADNDHWLANHASGRHDRRRTTFDGPNTVSVYLASEKDRVALKESFDVIKTQYLRRQPY